MCGAKSAVGVCRYVCVNRWRERIEMEEVDGMCMWKEVEKQRVG